MVREYFFKTNHRGLLFLLDSPTSTPPLNFTTSIKEPKFLAQFYKNLVRAPHTPHTKYQQFPFVSPCWGEQNYLASQTTPIVYNSLRDNLLIYSYGLTEEFQRDRVGLVDGIVCYRRKGL